MYAHVGYVILFVAAIRKHSQHSSNPLSDQSLTVSDLFLMVNPGRLMIDTVIFGAITLSKVRKIPRFSLAYHKSETVTFSRTKLTFPD